MSWLNELDEIELEIYRKYKYALLHIGVQLNWDEVQESIFLNTSSMESAFQRTIEVYKTGQLKHPTGFLMKALAEGYKSYHWNDEWLNDPNFKNPCLKYWEEAARVWGYDLRNALIIDVKEDKNGNQSVVFANGGSMPLNRAISLGWQQVLEYAQSGSIRGI